MDYIDILRGFACLWVLLHHSIEHHPVEAGFIHLPLRILVKFADLGWLGVSLFLVLSGFCLYYPLVRRNEPVDIRLNLREFAKRRATRILPPYYVVLAGVLLSTLLLNYFQYRSMLSGISLQSVGLHVVMLHNIRPSTLGDIVPIFWSLALESQLYILFPFFIAIVARSGIRTLLLSTFCIALVWQVISFSRLGFSLNWTPQLATWYHALPGRSFEFAAGMAAATIVASQKKLGQPAAIIALILLIPAIWYALFVSRFGPLLDQLWGVIFCCVIVLLNEVRSDLFQAYWALRALTWIGTVSYSLYLIHQPLFWLIRLPETGDSFLILATFGRMILVVALAYPFFLAFERPFIVRRKSNTNEVTQATSLSPAP